MSEENVTPIGGVKTEGIPSQHTWRGETGKPTVSMHPVYFMAHAKPMPITFGTEKVLAASRWFKQAKDAVAPSCGYFYSGKVVLEIGGLAQEFQVSCNITLIGSKHLAE